ncbi:caspase family protein [Streptomyces cinerochromogenes]|uniref:caspase family protein n=1 Tax=Streptomyces cinerochromogenes TaxID=66422 RepID=UPI0033A55FD5
MYRALIVCNSRFPEGPGALRELQGPKADGLLLRDALTDPTAGLFQRSEVRLVAEADAGEIIAAVDEFFSTAEADDTLLFYYSGHGRNRNRQLFLCAGNTRTDRLRSTALPAATLSDAISDSFAQVTDRFARAPGATGRADCCRGNRTRACACSSPAAARCCPTTFPPGTRCATAGSAC